MSCTSEIKLMTPAKCHLEQLQRSLNSNLCSSKPESICFDVAGAFKVTSIPCIVVFTHSTPVKTVGKAKTEFAARRQQQKANQTEMSYPQFDVFLFQI